jgi:predicted nuclease with TOPRIM domain
MKKRRLTKKERMNKLLHEKIEQFKEELHHDEAMLEQHHANIKTLTEAAEVLEFRIKQMREVIAKLSN